MDYDVVIIGSGFGGSVSALRLTEKGYRVGVLEAGRRFADAEFAENSWHLRDYLFAPRLGCTGIFRMTPLRDVLVLSGSGVGGGSLGYANRSATRCLWSFTSTRPYRHLPAPSSQSRW